jgi:hypothetical protein
MTTYMRTLMSEDTQCTRENCRETVPFGWKTECITDGSLIAASPQFHQLPLTHMI